MEVVLITGVSSSIGESIAVKLSENNIIILSGRNLEFLKNLKKKLIGTGHKIWLCDLLNDSIKDSLLEFLNKNNIKPNNFLHLGGEFSVAPIRLIKKIDIINSFQINIFSAIEILSILSKKEYKYELKNIIFFSSISAKKGYAGYGVYSSAKSALLGLTKSLSIELNPIKVNCIVLGTVISDKTKKLINDNKENISKHIPLGIANSDVLNEWVAFLLKNNNWMTGQELIIDGGATIL